MKLSRSKRVILSVIYENAILVEIDSFRYAEFWFPVLKISNKKYKNGFAIYFVINQKNILNDENYNRYKNSDLKLIELDENIENVKVKTFVKALEQTRDSAHLGREIKNIIEKVYFFEEQNPNVYFKIQIIPK